MVEPQGLVYDCADVLFKHQSSDFPEWLNTFLESEMSRIRFCRILEHSNCLTKKAVPKQTQKCRDVQRQITTILEDAAKIGYLARERAAQHRVMEEAIEKVDMGEPMQSEQDLAALREMIEPLTVQEPL